MNINDKYKYFKYTVTVKIAIGRPTSCDNPADSANGYSAIVIHVHIVVAST